MCCQSLWKKIVPFAIAFALGILAFGGSKKINHPADEPLPSKSHCPSAVGSGSGGGRAVDIKAPLRILSKPRPGYTDAARRNRVTGVVNLKVTFLASGQIGSVVPVSSLPDGLTEQAIAAAKQIRFEPALEDGSPQTVSRIIEYSFSIY